MVGGEPDSKELKNEAANLETSKIKGKINWKSQGNSKNIKNKWIISFHATSNCFFLKSV